MFKFQTSLTNTKFPWATYYTIVPSTEELYCLSRKHKKGRMSMQSNMLIEITEGVVTKQWNEPE